MPSVNSVFGLLEKIESANLSVNQNRCIVVRNRNVECMKCAHACTTGCISLEDNELLLSPEKCIGCGTCANVCPTGALEAKSPSDAELCSLVVDAARRVEGEAVVACETLLAAAKGLVDPEKTTGVACLGRMDESLLVTLATTEGVGQVTLVHGQCETCAHVCGSRVAELACDAANVLLETWRSPARVLFSDKLPGKTRLAQVAEYDHDRRAFFSDFKDGAKTIAVVSADHAMKEALGVEDPQPPKYAKVDARGVLPQEFPEGRRRLLEALDALGEPEEVDLTTRLWGRISIDRGLCTSCRMCATFCPTGAIFKFSTKKGKIGVKHRPRQCVGCGCCESICRTHALTLSHEVSSSVIASAEVSRFVMPPLENEPSGPHSILGSMKKMISCDQIYER